MPVQLSTNCCFGDDDLRSLYVTGHDGCLYSAHIASYECGGITGADFFVLFNGNGGCFDHGVGCLYRTDKALRFNHPECFEGHVWLLRPRTMQERCKTPIAA